MATDLSDIVKQGYIRVRSKSINIWQKRWIILRRASSKGPVRVDKYFDEKCARNGTNHKTSLLTNVATISRLPITCRKYAFSINFHDGSNKCFSCDSDLEADTWVKLAIQECLLPPPGLATGEPDVLRPGIQKELQEQFNVYLMPTPKLDVFGECLLQVTHENIYLWDISNSKLKLVAWPLTALRRYGSDLTKFTFEAGRHCATGEGMFVFHTLEGEKIYRKVHQATLAIAEAHHKMKKHSNHFIDLPQIETRITRQINSSSITCPRGMSSYALTANNATNEEYENDSDKNEDTGSSGQFMSQFNHQTSMSHMSQCRISQTNSPCVLLNTRCSFRASLFK